jgi:HME family heavy-metal exporter
MSGALAGVLCAGAAALVLPRAFLPPFNEGTLTINTTFTPCISLAESNRVGLIAERLLLEVPEAKAVGRRTGRAELDEHAEGVHSSEIEVDLKPSARSRDAIVTDIRSRLAVLPMSVNVGQPISHRLDHMLSGVRAQIALKIFGEDLDALARSAELLRARLSRIPGLVDLQIERQVRIPQIDIAVDHHRAALYGVQPAAITDELQRLSNGRVTSRIVDGNRHFDVVLRLDEKRRGTAGLADMLIQSPSGWIPVRQVADVKETDGPNQILRENGKRRIVVFANTDGKTDMARVVADIRREVAAASLPASFFTHLEGCFSRRRKQPG